MRAKGSCKCWQHTMNLLTMMTAMMMAQLLVLNYDQTVMRALMAMGFGLLF